MMSANNSFSHTPPDTWTCYTANGAQAAGASNIALGTYGPLSVDAFMRDSGGGNQIVGHRRWFHYSRAISMGTGDILATGPRRARTPSGSLAISSPQTTVLSPPS